MINQNQKKRLLDKIAQLCPHKRKPRFSNEYIFDKVILLLKDLQTWRSFARILPNTKIGHYTTIMKRFHKWSNAGVFKQIHQELLEENIFININSNTTLTCYIDATLIDNRNGVDLIGFGENKKKKATKLTAICNDDKKVLDIICDYKHDANMVIPVTNSLSEKVNFRKINIVGDKGYKLSKEKLDELHRKKVQMHVPKRKNEKKKTSKRTKNHLKKRYLVEHVFQQLKTFPRVRTRNDKESRYYMAFVYISLIIKFT